MCPAKTTYGNQSDLELVGVAYSPIRQRGDDEPAGIAEVLVAVVKDGVCLSDGTVVLLPVQAELTQPLKSLPTVAATFQHLVNNLTSMDLQQWWVKMKTLMIATYVRMHTCMYGIHACMYVRMYAYMHVCMYGRTSIVTKATNFKRSNFVKLPRMASENLSNIKF